MATTLTREEKQKIVLLYQEHKSFKEIVKETGRSVEAIKKTLGWVGLYDEYVQRSAWDYARMNYRGKPSWYELPTTERYVYFEKEYKELQFICRKNLSLLMGDITVSSDNNIIALQNRIDFLEKQNAELKDALKRMQMIINKEVEYFI